MGFVWSIISAKIARYGYMEYEGEVSHVTRTVNAIRKAVYSEGDLYRLEGDLYRLESGLHRSEDSLPSHWILG